MSQDHQPALAGRRAPTRCKSPAASAKRPRRLPPQFLPSAPARRLWQAVVMNVSLVNARQHTMQRVQRRSIGNKQQSPVQRSACETSNRAPREKYHAVFGRLPHQARTAAGSQRKSRLKQGGEGINSPPALDEFSLHVLASAFKKAHPRMLAVSIAADCSTSPQSLVCPIRRPTPWRTRLARASPLASSNVENQLTAEPTSHGHRAKADGIIALAEHGSGLVQRKLVE